MSRVDADAASGFVGGFTDTPGSATNNPQHTIPSTGEANKVVLIACGALAREIMAVTKASNWSHVQLVCLPATLHNRPERITPAVREKIRQYRRPGSTIYVMYGDCGSGGMLDSMLAEEGVERIGGPHCYAFFSGIDNFLKNADSEFDCFYLTDYLARQFNTLIWKGLGLDRHPELLPMYFAHYRKLVYLAQTDDAALTAAATAAAAKLGLVFERRYTGMGDLEQFLGQRISTPASIPASSPENTTVSPVAPRPDPSFVAY